MKSKSKSRKGKNIMEYLFPMKSLLMESPIDLLLLSKTSFATFMQNKKHKQRDKEMQ